MQINEIATSTGDDTYYERGFMLFLYEHRDELINSSKLVNLGTLDTYVYEGDFYGLLDFLNIPKPYHYATLIANRFYSPNTDLENTFAFKLPNGELVEKLKNYYITKKDYVG